MSRRPAADNHGAAQRKDPGKAAPTVPLTGCPCGCPAGYHECGFDQPPEPEPCQGGCLAQLAFGRNMQAAIYATRCEFCGAAKLPPLRLIGGAA